MSKRRYWSPAEDRRLEELAGKVPAAVIATELGRPKGGVHARIKRLGLSGRLSGEHHWAARLSNLQAAMIGTLRDAGFSATEIKRAFGLEVAVNTINDIGACRTRR